MLRLQTLGLVMLCVMDIFLKQAVAAQIMLLLRYDVPVDTLCEDRI